MSHDLLRDCQLKLSLVLAADDPLLERIERALHTPEDEPTAIRVPVTVGFDERKMVGQLTLARDALPASPDWHLALGYRSRIETTQGYELVCVSILPDAKFSAVQP